MSPLCGRCALVLRKGPLDEPGDVRAHEDARDLAVLDVPDPAPHVVGGDRREAPRAVGEHG
eukprot:11177426-Lingulodinium_polyedra.AAC.1